MERHSLSPLCEIYPMDGRDGTMEHWNEGKGSAVYFTLGQPWMR